MNIKINWMKLLIPVVVLVLRNLADNLENNINERKDNKDVEKAKKIN